MAKLTYSVAREELPRLEKEWRSLISESSVRNVFISPVWLRSWWEEFADDRQLLLFSVRKDGRLVGVAPLMKIGDQLCFAGDSSICDYMDLTVRQGLELEVTGALLDRLEQEQWRELILCAVPSYSPTLSVLPAAAQAQGYMIRQDVEDVCPRLFMPSSWEDYLEGLTGRDLRELLRKLRRLGRSSQMEMEVAATEQEVKLALGDFIRLHVLSRAEKARFMTESMKRFFNRVTCDLAREGLVRLYFLKLNGIRTAAALCFDGDGERLLYNSGYDPAFSSLSVGILSKAMVIEQTIADGKRCFDFLRGAERYKYDLGGKDLAVHRLVIRRN